MTAPGSITAAPPQGMSDADAMLAQSDEDFAKTFGLPVTGAAPAAPPAPAAPATPDPAAPPPSGEAPARADGRDELGRFVKEGATADLTTPPAEAPKAEAPPATPGAPAAVAPAKPLAEFKVFDQDGDEVEVPPLEVQFKGNKQVQKVPLDRLVRLAQFGAYNETLQQEAEQARTTIPTLEREVQAAREMLGAQQALNRRLLADEQFYLQSTEAWQKAQTPEARAARAEAALRERDDRDRATSQHGAALAFLPRMEQGIQSILDTSPDVSFEEVWGRFTLRTASLLVRGAIPPEKYAEVESLIASDLRPWAQQLSDRRAQQSTQRTTAADNAVQQAREEVAQTKRLLTRKLQPIGAPPERQALGQRPTKPPETADEAVKSVLADVEAAFSGGRG